MLADKLGKEYDKVREQAKLRTIKITLGEVTFDLKVKIPLKREMEEMTERITSPSQEKIDAIFVRLSKPIKDVIAESGEEFVAALNATKESIVIKDDDIIVDGNSVRQVATFTAIHETRVEEYFHLLQSVTGEPITESYEEIAEEFPDIAIKEIVEVIENAIKPDYTTAKKN